jgi:hypothetical protein
MNAPELNVEFIRSKIDQIKSALFSNLIESEYRFPTCIISAIKVDNNGVIWFLMNKAGRLIPPGESGFPAELIFYKKNHPFSLRVSGMASVIADPKSIENFLGLENNREISNILLISLRMSRAEYSEKLIVHTKNWLKRMWSKLEAFIYPIKYKKEFSINLSSVYETIPY